jgi:acyl-CoA thioesterase
MGFDADIALRPAGSGAFDIDVPAHWTIARAATNGGYVAAAMTRALGEAVGDPDHLPRSLTVHYLAACGPGPARVGVTREREGRSVTVLSARMTQGQTTVALALAAFGRVQPGLDFQHEPMPEAPPPEELSSWLPGDGVPAFPTNWEYRWCIGGAPYSRSERAVSGGWIRPREPRLVDAPLVAAMADGWIPPVLLLLDQPRGIVPTIDLTVHFRSALPLAGAAPGDFSFALFSSRVGAEGYWESDGVIWSRDGRVIAQARQLAVFRLRS